MTRPTARSNDAMAGCFVCHGNTAFWTSANAQALAAQHHDRTGHQTWCRIDMSVTYGVGAGDDRQIDIEDAIASANSRGKAEAPPLNGLRARAHRPGSMPAVIP